MNSLKEDLSKLTTISEQSFEKLIQRIYVCICDSVEEAILEDRDVAEIDVGIGVLTISFKNNELKYRFTPNKKLDKLVVDTVVNEQNLFKVSLDKALVTKITNTYKNFF